MTEPHAIKRQASSETQQDVLGEDPSLMLSRTRSPEPSAVESIVVQDVEESKPGDHTDAEPVQYCPPSTKYYVLLCAFLTSLSFGVTQVPLLYVFRLMTCDAYYKDHGAQAPPEWLSASNTNILSYAFNTGHFLPSVLSATRDRCSIHEIESSTALSISLLGASTTIFGLLNLFLTNSLIKRIGVKPTLLIQVFFPALRLLIQNIGVEVWGSLGIIIVQCSQVVSIIGGPSGYLLVLNTFITEVVEYEERTAVLGRLTGSMMCGSASGFLLGGVMAETFGIRAPFRLTLLLFLVSCAFVALVLPNIAPAEKTAQDAAQSNKKISRVLNKVFGPLTAFAPQKFMGSDGVVRTEYGSFLLAWGVFLGILATGYLPTLLQLYATDVFAFGTKLNGWLIFIYSMLRGVFLTVAFPKIIAVGRRWTSRMEENAPATANQSPGSERQPLLGAQHSTNVVEEAKKEQTFTFDLTYTRFSLIADGILTLLCTFVRQGWQMYLVAAVLPFAAGTSSAAKGTVLQMVGSSASRGERTDALAGVSLIENMARLSTTFVFGVIFAAFADVGRTELVFTCNAAFALVGFVVLLFAHFPLEGSYRLAHEEPSAHSRDQ